MKQIFPLIALLLFCISVPAQEQAKYRIAYHLNYKPITNKNGYSTLEWNLDIGNTTSVFYCKDTRLSDQEFDSLRRSNLDMASAFNSLDMIHKKYPNTNNLEILRTLHKQLYTLQDKVLIYYFRYQDSIPTIQWDISNEEKDLLGMKCKKATGNIMNRIWNVWYTEDIPFSNGPWLLSGLPGLILEAEDSENIFKFTCTELKNNPNDLIQISKHDFIKCKKQKFLKLRKENDDDNVGFEKKMYGEDKVIVHDAKGNLVTHSVPVQRNYFER
jgi:GLPGLI family protein